MCYVAALLLSTMGVLAQSGYIIKVDGDKVYMNLPGAKVSDVVPVFNNGGSMTDPKSGRNIQIEPEVIGQIKIIAVQGAYSVGRVYGNTATYPEKGMTVGQRTVIQKNNYGETTVMIAPAEVNFPQVVNTMVGSGYIGDYVSDVLMEHLLKCNKIKLVDRSILSTQQNEIAMGQSGGIDPNTALEYGKISGARYLVKITLLQPDVVNVGSNIPVKGIAITLDNSISRIVRQPVNNYDATQGLPNNVKINNVKVSVRIVVRVVDLQTGNILFTSNGEGVASGQPKLSWEYDFGTLENTGEQFTQTVTGKAVDKAFRKIGKELNEYFDKNL